MQGKRDSLDAYRAAAALGRLARVRRQVGLDGRDVILVGLLIALLIGAAILIKGRWLAVTATVVTLVGVAIAIGQVRLARDQIQHAVTVGEATQKAVLVTRDKVARALFIEAIGDLTKADRDLFGAIHEERPAVDVAECLTSWRDGAFDVVALMDNFKGLPRGLRNSLIETGKAAAEIRDALDADAAERRTQTAQIRSDISAACGLLSSTKMKLKLDIGEESA